MKGSNKIEKSKSVFISTSNKINRLTSRKPSSNKHCPQDIACLHCCQCWLNFQQEYNKRIKYFQRKTSELTTQNQLLKKCLEKLTGESQKLKNKVKNSTDLATIKQNLRKQLSEQLDSKLKINNLIQQQKVKSLTQELKISIIQVNTLQKYNNDLSQKLSSSQVKIRKISQQLENMKKTFEKQIKLKNDQIKQQTQKIASLNKEVNKLNQRIIVTDNLIKKKDGSISSMISTIDHSDRLIERQMQKMAEKQSQKQTLHLQFNNKSQQLNKIQKISQQHTKSIVLLSSQKNKLYSLVDSLKDELVQKEKQNHILKFTLNDVQFLAREKSISLENLKYDVSMLKYRL